MCYIDRAIAKALPNKPLEQPRHPHACPSVLESRTRYQPVPSIRPASVPAFFVHNLVEGLDKARIQGGYNSRNEERC
ncbi:MAG: hypothetical protein WBN87_14110, partial [Thermoanaerobaculia bacterium]